ncbi:guanine nucleotide-binding protein subunit alpha-11-like isoform X4 [Syngnathoides biaculeatus]|uniref:guanine nucleotide-binding protein subunit alpha-11-like isoform X4 n=1 Tax=Syngnathoides biaculeatus TaxID=300417 RepID=UPI002ADE54F8|nr:guanine nucleotide-binding protein subunit alpha-11-like isoform X4 [Syngnathoides biaculeatus]
MFCCVNILPAPLQACLGVCLRRAVTEESKEAKLQNSKIDQDLSEQARAEMNVVKVLMLGTAESGKSTLVKQIKIIHSGGFSRQELTSFKPAVLDNLLTSMKFVLRGMGMLRINLANKKNNIHARAILSCCRCFGDDQELLPFVAHAFCALWADQGVRAAAARGYDFQLNDSALYFFENIGRIIAPNYTPTEQDVLRVRVRTCGIIETQFHSDDMIFRLYDVGGQRSVRRKWLRCFDGIQALLFVVALSSYDMSLPGDPKAEKILHSGRHLRVYVANFKGADADVDAAARHIAAMFSTCGGGDRPLFHHFTTATDTADVRAVFQVATAQILKRNLANARLL